MFKIPLCKPELLRAHLSQISSSVLLSSYGERVHAAFELWRCSYRYKWCVNFTLHSRMILLQPEMLGRRATRVPGSLNSKPICCLWRAIGLNKQCSQFLELNWNVNEIFLPWCYLQGSKERVIFPLLLVYGIFLY